MTSPFSVANPPLFHPFSLPNLWPSSSQATTTPTTPPPVPNLLAMDRPSSSSSSSTGSNQPHDTHQHCRSVNIALTSQSPAGNRHAHLVYGKFESSGIHHSHGTTRDSGLGTTKGTISSGSSSANTSPDSEKDTTRLNFAIQLQSTSTPSAHRRCAALKEVNERLEESDAEFEEEEQEADLAVDTLEEEEDVDVVRLPKSASAIAPTVQQESAPTKRRQRRMHPCEYCEKQFDRPSLLKRHTLTHTGERPFQCKYCAKGFSTRSGVNTHERTHTGQRPYVCRICGRRFAAGSNLIFHKYTHTNNRRHACQVCPKAFLTPGDLRKHEYTHTGEWPFKCALCSRGFATQRNLKSHELTHSGKKPFCCSICHRNYAQESSLKTHMKLHNAKTNVIDNSQANFESIQTRAKYPVIPSQQKSNSQSFLVQNLLDDGKSEKNMIAQPHNVMPFPRAPVFNPYEQFVRRMINEQDPATPMRNPNASSFANVLSQLAISARQLGTWTPVRQHRPPAFEPIYSNNLASHNNYEPIDFSKQHR